MHTVTTDQAPQPAGHYAQATVHAGIVYVSGQLPIDPATGAVVVGDITVQAERTFWDKMIILHGLRQWYERRGVLRHGGQRVSRHYYDVHQLLRHEQALGWLEKRALGADCATHARLFFGSADLGLDTAAPGSFTLVPPPDMREALQTDYAAMAGMIFGDVPALDAILRSIAEIERRVNA